MGYEPPSSRASISVWRPVELLQTPRQYHCTDQGSHLPEDATRVAHLVDAYSDNGRSPMMWCVRPQYYGYGFSWNNFPVDEDCFIHSSTGRNILCLEADATNSDDPLSLGDESLDLTIEDAAQGFRRIQQLYKEGKDAGKVPPFRTLRVFLGNSLEEARSGGGYTYTLRHRVRYAKEVDVLIDSRAPVLQEGCAGAKGWRERTDEYCFRRARESIF